MSSHMFDPDPLVSSYDRLGFSVSIALAVHAAIILGISFSPFEVDKRAGASRLEITLAQFRSKNPVEDADYLAQNNQQASGTEATKSEITTNQLATYNDIEIRNVSEPEVARAPRVNPQSQAPQLTTQAHSQFAAAIKLEQLHEPRPQLLEGKYVLPHENEVASLQAKYDAQQRSLAKRPRIARVISVASKQSSQALYRHQWLRRVEKIGNAHYPEQSRRRKIYGHLRLAVQITADGKLKSIEILERSGKPVLDQAAKDIVRMAAPFEAFPTELHKEYDVIEIIRTWIFEKNQLTSSQ